MDIGLSISVFILGLAGSLHCVGMCGPLQMFIAKAPLQYKFLYHYGRYIAYALVGIVFYGLGYTSYIFSLQKYFTILGGVVIIFVALSPVVLLKIPQPNIIGFIHRYFGGMHPSVKYFFSGLGNGFLPCGLVYIAASQCILSISVLGSLWLMFLFFLGTMPALLTLNFMYKWMRAGGYISKYLKASIVVAMGVLMIFRGLYSQSQINGAKHHAQNCVVVK